MQIASPYRSARALVIALFLAATSPAALAENKSDMWWNPNESGRGLIVIDHGTDMVLVWCTYGADGIATWYIVPGGSFNPERTVFSGNLYSTRSPALEWYVSEINLVGTASLNFSLDDLPAGWAAFSIRQASAPAGVLETHYVTRQPFGSGTAAWGTGVTDLWWYPSEPGWGVATIQHGQDDIFAVMLIYTNAGYPTWQVVPARRVPSSGATSQFAGSLYITSTPGGAAPFNASAVRVEYRSSAAISFPTEARPAQLFLSLPYNYLSLLRQPFGQADEPPVQMPANH